MRPTIRNGIVTLKYLTSTTNRIGVTYYYLRRKGTKTPLGRGPIDSPDFLQRYADAMGTGPKPITRASAGSIASTCDAFKAGTVYGTYSQSYQGTLDRHLGLIRDKYGEAPINRLQAKHIRLDLDNLQPHAASNRLKTWRLICTMAYERGWAPEVATDGVKAPKAPKTDGHTPWTSADVAAYRKRWEPGTVQRLCMELLYWTGARTIDAVTLSSAMIGADGVLTFTQAKTGGKAYVPWSCALPAWAQPFEIDRSHLMNCLETGRFTYLEAQGKARSRKGLSNVIKAGATGAKLSGLSAHGLRKARLTAIAEAGGSASAIMSWGGHKSLSEAEDYISSANRKSVIIGTEQDQNSANTPIQSANTKGK